MCSSIKTQVEKVILCIRKILCWGLECHGNQWGGAALPPSPIGLAPPIGLQGIVNLAPISSLPAPCVTFHLDEGNGLQASPPVSQVFLLPSIPSPPSLSDNPFFNPPPDSSQGQLGSKSPLHP